MKTERALDSNPSDQLAKRLDSIIDRLVFLGDIREKKFSFEKQVSEPMFREKIHSFSRSTPNAFLRSYGKFECDADGQGIIQNFSVMIERSFEHALVDSMQSFEPRAEAYGN